MSDEEIKKQTENKNLLYEEREMKLPLNTIILTFFILLFFTLIFVLLKKVFKSARK